MKSVHKKTKRQKLERELDKLWSAIVRKRDGDICCWCGKYGDNPHHIKGRARRTTRFNPTNGVLLCRYCHFFKIRREPIEYTAFLFKFLGRGNSALGKKKYEVLRVKSEVVHKQPLHELMELTCKLKEELTKLKGEGK